MAGSIKTDSLSANERLEGIAQILAVVLMRPQARQSSHLSAAAAESSLDYAADQSGHAGGRGRIA
jgi:hypothetical protein